MTSQPSQLPPTPRDHAPRRYKDAPTIVLKSGYVLEWCPTHPRAAHGTVPQHRIVMECHLGRFLRREEPVHHKNGVRSDNRIENLEVQTSWSEHMRQHWQSRGRRCPKLVEQVLQIAKDPTKSLGDLPCSPTTAGLICRAHGVRWVGRDPTPNASALTEQSVSAALHGRTTAEAAQALGVTVMTLYRRFGHLLKKRASPGFLDEHKDEILRLIRQRKMTREEVAEHFSTNYVTVAKSIRRWKAQDATLDVPVYPPKHRWRRERELLHMVPDTGPVQLKHV